MRAPECGVRIRWKSLTSSERIHLRQNIGDKSLLNTPQELEQDSKGEAVRKDAVGGGCF